MERILKLHHFSDFTLDPFLKETIKSAKTRFDEVTSSLEVAHLQYTRMTKTDVKKAKLSPDSVMQLAVQVKHCFTLSLARGASGHQCDMV